MVLRGECHYYLVLNNMYVVFYQYTHGQSLSMHYGSIMVAYSVVNEKKPNRQ